MLVVSCKKKKSETVVRSGSSIRSILVLALKYDLNFSIL